MPYRKVAEYTQIPVMALPAKLCAVYDAIDDKAAHMEQAGLAGVLHELSTSEHFDRLIAVMPGLRKGESPFAAEYQRDAVDTMLADNTIKAIHALMLTAMDLLAVRMQHGLTVAEPAQKQGFRDVSLKGRIFQYSNTDDLLPNTLEEGQLALRDMNMNMDAISADHQVPDKLQRLCEAIYTMATADKPLSFAEAQAAVSKTTLIPPKRGGAGQGNTPL